MGKGIRKMKSGCRSFVLQVVESLYGQDLDSGHHGSGFPLPPFRQCLLEQHLAQQAAALREKSGHEAVTVNLPPRRFSPEEEEYSHHSWNINNLPRNRVTFDLHMLVS